MNYYPTEERRLPLLLLLLLLADAMEKKNYSYIFYGLACLD